MKTIICLFIACMIAGCASSIELEKPIAKPERADSGRTHN